MRPPNRLKSESASKIPSLATTFPSQLSLLNNLDFTVEELWTLTSAFPLSAHESDSDSDSEARQAHVAGSLTSLNTDMRISLFTKLVIIE